MNGFTRGDIVSFGPLGNRRVGIVIGSYDDPALGEVLCVRTPQNAAKEQKFDPCPVGLMAPEHATIDDLIAAVEQAKHDFEQRLAQYLDAAPSLR